jgi:trimethylamine--corrinoid protein Co-methyltransferase
VTTVVWDDADCSRAHAASGRVLQEAGVELPHEEARALLAAAGARVEGARVFVPAAVVDQALETAPAAFEVPGRGKGGMVLEEGRTYFGTGPDCMYVHDPLTGVRRRAVLDDVRTSAALCDHLDQVDFVMTMALPGDAPIVSDDVRQFAAMLEGTSKPLIMSTSHGGDSLAAMRDMAALCGEARSFACLVMSSPPLRFDRDAADKLIGCARLGIPAVLAPAPSAGATAPASMSAAVIVGDAEVLAGLCIHQLACPGAPFVYGVGAAALDMRTALDPYVGPDHYLGNQAGTDLARHYGLPSWSYAGPSDAKTLDEQWSADVAITTLLGALSRATLLHDLGYMESGLGGSLESIVLGAEMAGFARAYLRELPLDEEALQLDEIIAAGPGGNHLGRPYTRKHHRDSWQTRLFDHTAFERWQAEGAESLRERVTQKTRELMVQPPDRELAAATRAGLQRLIDSVEQARH